MNSVQNDAVKAALFSRIYLQIRLNFERKECFGHVCLQRRGVDHTVCITLPSLVGQENHSGYNGFTQRLIACYKVKRNALWEIIYFWSAWGTDHTECHGFDSCLVSRWSRILLSVWRRIVWKRFSRAFSCINVGLYRMLKLCLRTVYDPYLPKCRRSAGFYYDAWLWNHQRALSTVGYA